MKSESQIAKENVEEERKWRCLETWNPCMTHKQTCERWLEYLECYSKEAWFWNLSDKDYINNKIKDLKQAIKLYEDAGI